MAGRRLQVWSVLVRGVLGGGGLPGRLPDLGSGSGAPGTPPRVVARCPWSRSRGSAWQSSPLWLFAAAEGRPPFDRPTVVGTLIAVATEHPDPIRRATALNPVIGGLPSPGSAVHGKTIM